MNVLAYTVKKEWSVGVTQVSTVQMVNFNCAVACICRAWLVAIPWILVYAILVVKTAEALTIRAVVVQILVVTLRVRVVVIQILVSVWAMFRAVATNQTIVVAKFQLILVVCIQTRAVGIQIRAVELNRRVALEIQIRAVVL